MNQRGIALVLALTALLVLGLIATTGVVLAMREAELGRSSVAAARAEGAADAAVAEGFRGWNRALTPIAPGDSVILTLSPLPGALRQRLVLRALGGPILSLQGTGQSLGRSGILVAQSRVELLIRLDSALADTLVYPRAITRGWRRIP